MSNNFDISGLGDRIRYYRHRLGLTQTALAEMIHVSFQAISIWENAISLPDLENLCEISEIFGVSLDDLLRSDDGKSTVMIGIDGGGTKTEFVMFDTTGKVLRRVQLSGTNASLIGIDETVRILTEGIGICLAENRSVSGIFAGIAGPKLDVVKKRLSERYMQIKIEVRSDGVNAFRSADGDFALICGTGSIIITKTEDGYRRYGGWGARFGDPGSAYNFGRAALRCGFAYEDGISHDSTLYDMLVRKNGLLNLRTAIGSVGVPYIASLSTVVFEAYEKGCPDAISIINDEMKELSWLLDSTFPSGGTGILCGGIMENRASLLIPILNKYLKASFEFIQPALPPIYGACVAYLDEMGLSCDADFVERFTADYTRLVFENK